jgi:hypothetical protein
VESYYKYLSCKKRGNQPRHMDVCISLKCSKLEKVGGRIMCTYKKAHERRKESQESRTVFTQVAKHHVLSTENLQLSK